VWSNCMFDVNSGEEMPLAVDGDKAIITIVSDVNQTSVTGDKAIIAIVSDVNQTSVTGDKAIMAIVSDVNQTSVTGDKAIIAIVSDVNQTSVTGDKAIIAIVSDVNPPSLLMAHEPSQSSSVEVSYNFLTSSPSIVYLNRASLDRTKKLPL